MKRLLYLVLIVIFCNCSIVTVVNAQDKNDSTSFVNRFLIITFKPGTSADSIKLIDDAYVEISKLPMIKSFETGVWKSNSWDKDSTNVKHMYILKYPANTDYGKN